MVETGMSVSARSSSEDEGSPVTSDRRSVLLEAKLRGFHLPMPRPHPVDGLSPLKYAGKDPDEHADAAYPGPVEDALSVVPWNSDAKLLYSSAVLAPGFAGFRLLRSECRRLRIIGEGSFASVFIASGLGDGDVKVAVKKVRPEADFSQQIAERAFDYQDVVESLRHELEVLRSLGPHPHIISVLAASADGSEFAMPLAYTDLYIFIKQQHAMLSLSRAKLWTQQLVRALACIHEHNFVHSDIKSSNILLMPDANPSAAFRCQHRPRLLPPSYSSPASLTPALRTLYLLSGSLAHCNLSPAHWLTGSLAHWLSGSLAHCNLSPAHSVLLCDFGLSTSHDPPTGDEPANVKVERETTTLWY
jgi:hypothetical protein